MSKSYRVTVRGSIATDVWEMVVEFSDSLAHSKSEAALENWAKKVSKEAIIRRWQKLSPENQGEPNFVESFEVEPFPHFDPESVDRPGYGPYPAQTGVRVWMTNGPRSFGMGAPRELGHGGAW